MKIKSYIVSLVLVLMLSTVSSKTAFSQTEGFNVKTPIEKIADSTTNFLKAIMDDAKKNPDKSIPQSLVCGSKCFLVVPNIEIVESRGDFKGTGLLACRTESLSNFTEPIFYEINNIDSFSESDGGLIILVEDDHVLRTLLGAELHLSSENTTAGPIGKTDGKDIKPIISYVKFQDQDLAGIDLANSVLEYESKDTFDAYQDTIIPIEILVNPQDVPPILRDYDSLLNEWTKDCK